MPNPALDRSRGRLTLLMALAALVAGVGWLALSKEREVAAAPFVEDLRGTTAVAPEREAATPALAQLEARAEVASRTDLSRTEVMAPSGAAKADEAPAEVEVVVVEPFPVIELRVLEKGTGSHLDRIEVRASTGIDSAWLDPAGHSRRTLAEDAHSPVRLTRTKALSESNQVEVFVRAEGYAWDSMTVDFTRSGERTIELVRAGSLRVALSGELPPDAILMVRGKRRLVSNRRATPKGALCESMAPGEYVVTVAVGKWYRSPLVLVSQVVTVEAGVESKLTLEVEPMEPVVTATLGGQVYVPVRWEITSPRLSLELLSKSKTGGAIKREVRSGELEPVKGRPGLFDLQVDGLETGRYSITMEPLHYAKVFELPPEGLAGFAFEIPPPIDIVAVVEDASTGEDVPGVQGLFWSPSILDGMRSWGSSMAERDPRTGEFPMRVPACKITVHAQGQSYIRDLQSFTPQEGEKIVVQLRVRPTAWIKLRSGDRSMPWPSLAYGGLTKMGGESVALTSGGRGHSRWLGVDEPGLYVLKVPKISGFQQHAPVEIEMEVGPRKTVVIELVPE